MVQKLKLKRTINCAIKTENYIKLSTLQKKIHLMFVEEDFIMIMIKKTVKFK